MGGFGNDHFGVTDALDRFAPITVGLDSQHTTFRPTGSHTACAVLISVQQFCRECDNVIFKSLQAFERGGIQTVCRHIFFITFSKKMRVVLVFVIHKTPCFIVLVSGIVRTERIQLFENILVRSAVFGNGFQLVSPQIREYR